MYKKTIVVKRRSYVNHMFLSDLVLLECILAGIPLVASILALVFLSFSDGVIGCISILMFACSVSLFINRVKIALESGKIASLAVITGFLFWYAIPALYDCFFLRNNAWGILPVPIDNQTIGRTLMLLSLFLFSWVHALGFFSSFYFFKRNRNLHGINIKSKSIIIFGTLGCFIGFIPYAIFGIGLGFIETISLIFKSRIVDKPWIYTLNLGNRISPFLYIAQCMMVSGGILLWMSTQDNRLRDSSRFIFGIIASFVSAVIIFDQGTRSLLALVILPVVLYKIFGYWKHSGKKFILASIMSLVIIIFLFQFQLYFRDSTTRADISKLIFMNWMTLGGTSDYFIETAFSVKLVPFFHEYFNESALLQFLLSPVPRFLWPSKPVSGVVWYYSLHRWGIDIYEGSGNVFPGAVGQYYMSWGVLGPIYIALLMAWVSARVDRLSEGVNDLYLRGIAITLSVWIFLTFRIISPSLFYPVVIAGLIVYFSREYKKNANNYKC